MLYLQLLKNLRTLRKTNHLTQYQLSVMLNTSRQAYSHYEVGKRTPDLDILIHLSQIYNISLDELILQDIGGTLPKRQGPYLSALNVHSQKSLQLTDGELRLLLQYRNLSINDHRIANAYMRMVGHRDKREKRP
ncbi:MAG: helix-turn-helix transcriptional regulator [Lachnospiraceae bacterium]